MDNDSLALTATVIDLYSHLGTATIHEALGQAGDLDPAVAPLWPGAYVCGPAFTVECPARDNLMIHHALATAAPGDVLVVTVGDSPPAGLWGLIMTRAAMVRGITGLVTDGWIRDSDAVEAVAFPVFCRGRAIHGTTKSGVTPVGSTITIGGQTIARGDLVVGDRDGVVVVPRTRVRETLQRAMAREQKENEILERLDQGASTVELLGLRNALSTVQDV
jgi:4-hydroxy-4-methyl-2-oxoglutarate aldolase